MGKFANAKGDDSALDRDRDRDGEAVTGERSTTKLVGAASAESIRAVAMPRSVRLSGESPSPLDRLLGAMCVLPVDQGEEAVIRAAVEALGSLLPSHQVGATFVPSSRSGDGPAWEPRRVILNRPEGDGLASHPPDGERRQDSLHDAVTSPGPVDEAVSAALRSMKLGPERLFPAEPFEQVLDVDTHLASLTLHIAADDSGLEDEGSFASQIARRAAMALTPSLAHARAHRELMEANARLVQTDKLASFGQLAAGILHELNNPLTSILAYTDLLLRKHAATPGEDLERLRRIADSANRVLGFTRDLVTYARPTQGTRMPVSLQGVVEQAAVFCDHEMAVAGARLECHFDADVLINGLPQQLVQVFVNLFTNACHAMPKDRGVVVVTTLREGTHVRVVVEDNGHGITREHLGQVFAPFFTTKGEGRGTGLGLSIVKSIVEGHEGTIVAESTPPAPPPSSATPASGAPVVPAAPSSAQPVSAAHRRGARFVLRLPVFR